MTNDLWQTFDTLARPDDAATVNDGTKSVEILRTRAALEALERELSEFLANASR
jgi:hypothetical protein